jgi:hypothetical protein
MKIFCLFIILLFLFVGELNATRYYVDNVTGNDITNSGTHPDTAWKSISKINLFSFQPGDIISFKCGARWVGETLIPQSNYLTFNSYGEGARPVIDRNAQLVDSVNADSIKFSETCVDLYNNPIDHITFSGLKFVHGYNCNIYILRCSNITFESCNIDSTVRPYPGEASGGGQNILAELGYNLSIRNSTMSYSNGGHGIYVNACSNVLLENDIIQYNGQNGINFGFDMNDPYISDSDTVRYCVIRENSFAGIYDDGCKNSSFYYNLIENNSNNSNSDCIMIVDQSFAFDSSSTGSVVTPVNNHYYNNTFIGHGSSAHCMEMGSPDGDASYRQLTYMANMQFKNNIYYLQDTSSYGLKFWSNTIPSSWNFTNNNYYIPTGASHLFQIYTGINTHLDYNSLLGWKTAHPTYESNSIQANPTFTDSSGNYLLQNSSPAVLAGVGVGLTQDITGKQVADPPDIGAYQNATYLSGFIPTTQTLSGNVALTNDVVVPSGNTLTISPGTHIKVKNYTSITVYGTLDCHYDSQQGDITFDLYPNFESFEGDTMWLMVFFGTPSSSSILQHAAINHNYRTLCLMGANVTIANCHFLNSRDGVYFYNSAPSIINNIITNPIYGLAGEASGLSPWIQGNTITRSATPRQYRGIYLWNNTNSVLWKNNITGFDYGGYFGDGCLTQSNGDFFECNNIITDNNYGIATAGGSWTSLGDDDGYRTMSGIYNNSTYDVLTKEESGFVSFYNFFGANPKIFTDTATYNYVEFEGNQSTFPCGNQSNISTKNNILTNNSLHKSAEDNYLDGLRLEKEGKIDEAINFYKDKIQKDVFVKASLSKLASIKNKYSKPGLTGYFQSLLTTQPKYYGIIKNLIGDIYLQNDRFDDAITAFNNVINHSTTDHDGINARFEKLFAYLHIKNDPSTASNILSDIKGINSKDEEVQMRIIIAEDLINGSKKGLNKNVNLANVNIPKSYELYQNYPNPFNPVTTIRYQIPKSGTVTLKVYDILGKEVATLVNENKIEGSYDFSFNAYGFASGVYIYQLRVNDYVSSKKMILLK